MDVTLSLPKPPIYKNLRKINSYQGSGWPYVSNQMSPVYFDAGYVLKQSLLPNVKTTMVDTLYLQALSALSYPSLKLTFFFINSLICSQPLFIKHLNQTD